MTLGVADEIRRFERLIDSFSPSVARIDLLAPHAVLLTPIGARQDLWENKSVALTVMAITHGSETAGVPILNEVLETLQKQVLKLDIPLCFILGNVDAALKGRRFVESDLNRSFMRATLTTQEHHRARQLEPILGASRFLLDLHQTRLPSEEPFFIFPFTRGGFEFAQRISGTTPIVTHWGRPFSKDGRCTDEFCNAQGGTGVSLELGQNGMHPYRIASGYKHVIHAIEVVTRLYRGETVEPRKANEIFTWAQVVEFPATRNGELKPGFVNFRAVAKDEVLGQIDGVALVAQQEGRLLFPYYPVEVGEPAPAELIRIMKKITESDLPS